MSITAAELKIRVTAETAQGVAGLKSVESQVQRTSKSFIGNADRMAKTGGTLTKRVTLPIVAMGAGAVKAFADFDSAMTQSTAIMGDLSKKTRDQMEKVARDVAKTTSFSAKEAAESYFFLASAGLDAAQSIKAMPQVAAFAQAGMFDMARATDLATDAQSALGLTVKDAEQNFTNLTRVTDVLVKANTLANASVEQFSEALTNRAGAALRSVNKDVEEGVAVLAALADQGIKGNVAGQQLAIVMRDLQKAAIKEEEAFRNTGVAVFDSSGQMRNMADIVGDLESATAGMSDKQKRATFGMLGFTDKSLGALLALMGTSDAIRGYEKDLRNAAGTTQDVAAKQMETFSEQMKLVKDRVLDSAISLGKVLAPIVLAVAGVVAVLVEKITNLPGPAKAAVAGFLVFAAVAGPLLVISAKLIKSVQLLRGALAGLKAGKAVGALGKLGRAFVAVGKGAARAVVSVGRATAQMAVAAARATASAVAAIARQVVAWTVLGAKSLLAAAKVAAAWIIAMGPIGLAIAAVVAAVVLIVKHWDTIKAATVAAWNFVARAISTAVSAVIGFVKQHWPLLLGILAGPIGLAVGLIIKHWDKVKAAASAVWNAVSSIVGAATNAVHNILSSVWGAIASFLSSVWGGIRGAASAVWGGVTSIIGGLVGRARDLIVGGFNTARDLVLGVFGAIRNAAATARDAVVGFVRGMVDGIVRQIRRAIDWFKKLAFWRSSPSELEVSAKLSTANVLKSFHQFQQQLSRQLASLPGVEPIRVMTAAAKTRAIELVPPTRVVANVSGGPSDAPRPQVSAIGGGGSSLVSINVVNVEGRGKSDDEIARMVVEKMQRLQQRSGSVITRRGISPEVAKQIDRALERYRRSRH